MTDMTRVQGEMSPCTLGILEGPVGGADFEEWVEHWLSWDLNAAQHAWVRMHVKRGRAMVQWGKGPVGIQKDCLITSSH
jgi:hypothetical protein